MEKLKSYFLATTLVFSKVFLLSVVALETSDITEINSEINNSRCTIKELKEFSEEYEACHQRALATIRSQRKIQVLTKAKV